jgi:DNA-directed RNA polymerase subunit H (RpoH/RPB5)
MSEKELIYLNILELIKYRKYNLLTKDLNNILTQDDYLLINTDKALIFYIINYDAGIIKKSDLFLKKINELLKSYNNKKIVLITKSKLSSNIYKKIFTIKTTFIIEVLLYNALIFVFPANNVNDFTEYINLSDNEKTKILDFLDITPKNLLYICHDDIACIWFDLNENDIVQVNTISPLSNIININYRLVTSDCLSNFRWVFTNNLKSSDVVNDDDGELSHKSDVTDVESELSNINYNDDVEIDDNDDNDVDDNVFNDDDN